MPRVIAVELRRRGIDVTTAQEAGLAGRSDRSILLLTMAQGRVVVTADADYLRLRHEIHDHAGIVYYRPRERSIGEVIDGLVLIHGVLDSSDLASQVEFL